ncbi:Thymidylate kinase domain protein (plasmid) [Candidatus Trichorickettsia mobilis]|uniref:dTMP kinase n=1 Tax=Candidatus Trichorickettsia mobilis TaxID=1346319 RepID=UPI002B260F43|nr:dTMP kinase [Candidatus Trichorickettsia mobilis]WPY01782.1 Thymidylate kinase domain protein [Candidatus Trichorickettsia mobilis]
MIKPNNYEVITVITKDKNTTTNSKLYDSSKAKFISFEGGEGCGKSTQCKMLYDSLQSFDIKVVLTREIGGVESSEAIRNIVVNRELLPMSELMLVMAARFEHVNKLILPKLREGYWVICDRFIDSTACYQGFAQGVGVEKIYRLHQDLMLNLMPDITFFIDVESTKALQRALSRNDVNKFEAKNLEFHWQVSQGFQQLAERYSSRIARIDADGLDPQEVHHKVIQLLSL